MTGDYSDTSSFIFDTCSIEINGDVSHYIFCGQLVNSRLSGNVTLLNGGYSAISIYNQGDQSYPNSVIDMTVECSSAWNVYNYSSYAETGLLINTSRLQNATLTGATGIFIACDDEEMVDSEWLLDEGFDVGEISTSFSWHDWLMNGNSVRVTSVQDNNGNSIPFTVDGSNDTFLSTVTLNNNGYCYSYPQVTPQGNVYNISVNSYHKYKLKLTGTFTNELIPIASIYRNGESYLWSFAGLEGVFTTPDSTSTLTLALGVINHTGNTVTGDFTFTNVELTQFSYWAVVNGKLVNPSLPDIPILGAFCNARNLTKIEIPATVKKIGRYAFTNTQLNSVTIASDCTYYDTSFPVGCVINTY